jgi:hypothetical protein
MVAVLQRKEEFNISKFQTGNSKSQWGTTGTGFGIWNFYIGISFT